MPGMACSGRMPRPAMGRTGRSTTASSAGADAFDRIVVALPADVTMPESLMIDSTSAHRTAAGLAKNGWSALHRTHKK